jgi:hypothetical protein
LCDIDVYTLDEYKAYQNRVTFFALKYNQRRIQEYKFTDYGHQFTYKPFKDEAQSALFKDPVRTAL